MPRRRSLRLKRAWFESNMRLKTRQTFLAVLEVPHVVYRQEERSSVNSNFGRLVTVNFTSGPES